MLTGSMALNFYGHPRATNDFDIVIEVQKKDVDLLFDLFKSDFYISADAVSQALSSEGIFNIIDNDSVFKIDLIVRKKDPFSNEQFERRRTKQLGDLIIHVISPEDLILAKLIWAQNSGSELQMRDIKNILHILGNQLDKNYIEKWAKQLGVSKQLEDMYASA